jgi:hypothetical protein
MVTQLRSSVMDKSPTSNPAGQPYVVDVTGRYGGQQSLAPPALQPSTAPPAQQQPGAAPPPGFAPSAQPSTFMPLQPMVMPYPGMATATTPAGITYSQTAASAPPVGGGFVEPSASQASKKAALRGLVVSVALLINCCHSCCV